MNLEELTQNYELKIQTNTDWGSIQPNHRITIRRALAHSLQIPEEQFLDLKKRPSLDNVSISISHAENLGAFVWCKSKQSIGLDLEPFGAVEERVILRVSTAEELSKAPSATHLWCAKEAIFKSASKFGLKVISDIRVDWKSESEFVWTHFAGKPVASVISDPMASCWVQSGFVFCLYGF